MKIDIITIFPELFTEFINTSLILKARSNNQLDISLVNLRDYSHSKHKTIDDKPYGGGVGMLLQFPPIYDCITKLKKKDTKVIMLSPQGKLFTQSKAKKIVNFNHIILLCGRYEGFDERVYNLIDYEISIGNYILMGGEIPAMAIIETIARLIPGVINNQSVVNDSLNNNLLKHPQYTTPREYKGFIVPDIVISGNHKEIEKWQLEQANKRTLTKRPDLNKRRKTWQKKPNK